MSQGFIVNQSAVTSIGTSYDPTKAVPLSANAGDAKSVALPQSGTLDTLDYVLDETSGTVAVVYLFLSWDAAGDNPITGELALQAASATNPTGFVRGVTDTSRIMGSVEIGKKFKAPAGQTAAGRVYLHVKVNSGTVSAMAGLNRVNWTD